MKASELIANLQKLISEHGDLPVVIQDTTDIEGFNLVEPRISLGCDDNDKPVEFLICDNETALAFT